MNEYKVFIKDSNGNVREEFIKARNEAIATRLCKRFLSEGETIVLTELF